MMKPKKSNRANLENKRGIFLQIGLLISLSLAIAAFEWSSEANYEYLIEDGQSELFEEEFVPPTREVPPKPQPPPKQPEFLDIVEKIDPMKEEYLGLEVEPEPGMEIPLPVMQGITAVNVVFTMPVSFVLN